MSQTDFDASAEKLGEWDYIHPDIRQIIHDLTGVPLEEIALAARYEIHATDWETVIATNLHPYAPWFWYHAREYHMHGELPPGLYLTKDGAIVESHQDLYAHVRLPAKRDYPSFRPNRDLPMQSFVQSPENFIFQRVEKIKIIPQVTPAQLTKYCQTNFPITKKRNHPNDASN